jgi:hypothetical protein
VLLGVNLLYYRIFFFQLPNHIAALPPQSHVSGLVSQVPEPPQQPPLVFVCVLNVWACVWVSEVEADDDSPTTVAL